MINSKQLKHFGTIKKALAYNTTGQVSEWATQYVSYFGLDSEKTSQDDQENNSKNKKTLSLFTRYDARLQNGQSIVIFDQQFLISQLDNVGEANQRLNFIATMI